MLRAPAITWLLVSTWPEASMMTPEPAPVPPAVATVIATTESRTSATTLS